MLSRPLWEANFRAIFHWFPLWTWKLKGLWKEKGHSLFDQSYEVNLFCFWRGNGRGDTSVSSHSKGKDWVSFFIPCRIAGPDLGKSHSLQLKHCYFQLPPFFHVLLFTMSFIFLLSVYLMFAVENITIRDHYDVFGSCRPVMRQLRSKSRYLKLKRP